MYYCFNIVTGDVNVPEAILIRAIKPISGIDIMSVNRFNKIYDLLPNSQKLNLTNGPGKVCTALNINKNDNGKDLTCDEIFIEDEGLKNFQIKYSKRIGIENTGEAKDLLYRMILTN